MCGVCCELLKELNTEVVNHVADEVVVDHIVSVNDVEEDVIEHVGVKVKDEIVKNLDVGNLLKDDHIVVDVVSNSGMLMRLR